ncbi:MAG: hypothetical protein M3Q95_04535 [Bacteroidota bacterium]|nr:hypothetical protein [Bacteroidota bacterium]
MFRFTKIREYENLHILMWLLKDTCWVMNWEFAGIIMIVPTIAVAIHITWLRRDIKSDLFHNLAVCCWISANSIWMIGEFYFDDGLRPFATAFFVAGIASVTFYYVWVLPKSKKV